ncbi:MAG: OmpA family protein [Cyclobacteriaceae bacterium]
MKSFIYLILFLLLCVFGVFWNICINKKLGCWGEAPSVATSQTDEKLLYPLEIYNENGLAHSFPDGLRIKHTNTTPIIPEENMGIIDELASYLNKNDLELLTITGLFEQQEGDGSKWAGAYGKERAQYIKDLLVARGIPSSRITLESREENLAFDNENIHYGGFEFFYHKAQASADQPLVKYLYFATGQSDFENDPNLTSYTANLKEYVTEYPDKKITVIGHTDNTGDATLNYQLGKNRALAVKNYLSSKGVKRASVSTDSKGELAPIASNDTEEGRAKNRRIEIKIF